MVNVVKYIWNTSNNDGEFIDTKNAGKDEVSGLDSPNAVHLQNLKNIIFSYINITLIRNKFSRFGSLISSHVNI